ncbi:unnamed protein product [Penicillium bialowiezense]
MAPAHTFFDDPDPNDLYRTSTRPCQMAHRYYLRWIHTVYRPEISPLFFVQEWCAALEGVRAQFGPFCLLDIIIFNQFLTAVAFNPQAHAWVDSIHVPMDNMLPPTLMDQVYVDFLVFESHRMHLPLVPLSYECVPACIPEGANMNDHPLPTKHAGILFRASFSRAACVAKDNRPKHHTDQIHDSILTIQFAINRQPGIQYCVLGNPQSPTMPGTAL